MSDLDLSPLLINFGLSALAVVVTMAITMTIAFKREDHSIVDIVWGLGFAVIAAVSFIASASSGNTGRRTTVLVLVAIWGIRLGLHIGKRNAGHVDPRYVAIMRKNTGPVIPYVIRKIYGMQGVFMWIVSLPVQVAMYETADLGVLAFIGIALWVIGFAFESIGDLQLVKFKSDPANKGKILESGLWAWTRHPNYFGDSVVWFGLWFLALGHWAGIPTIVGPILITLLLTTWSGKALTEKFMARKRGPEYQEYLDRVSGFFPRPPRTS